MSPELHPDEEKLLVFTVYGATMFAVQKFEWTVKQVAILYANTPKDASPQKAWNALQRFAIMLPHVASSMPSPFICKACASVSASMTPQINSSASRRV